MQLAVGIALIGAGLWIVASDTGGRLWPFGVVVAVIGVLSVLVWLMLRRTAGGPRRPG